MTIPAAPTRAPRRRFTVYVIVLVFGLLGANAAKEAALGATGPDADPLILSIWQGVVSLFGLATAVGAWGMRHWAWKAAVGYGVITGTMVASLRLLLDLESESQPGLFAGGIMVLAISLLCARYLHRVTHGVAKPGPGGGVG